MMGGIMRVCRLDMGWGLFLILSLVIFLLFYWAVSLWVWNRYCTINNAFDLVEERSARFHQRNYSKYGLNSSIGSRQIPN